ncbi:MAG: NADH-quinone oxidoreductase subunit N [bacterium]|nr:NADH-quinone oxidoreductase subunit N [bacterium]
MNGGYLQLVTTLDYQALLPAIVVGGAAVLALLADLILPRRLANGAALLIGVLATILGALYAYGTYRVHYLAFGGGFVLDGLSVIFEEIVLFATLVTLLLFNRRGESEDRPAYVALVLWSATGAMVLSGAGNLMTLFLGVEILSLALYCLCAIQRNREGAKEAGLKYLILSSTASGFLLYGMALLFGATGSVALSALAHPQTGIHGLYALGIGIFLIGLAFKLALVPFHIWAPDVYEGAPLPVTAFMSVATKAGALAALARVIYTAVPQPEAHWILLPTFVFAAASMLIGNLGALAQTDIKRLLAYSSIAQAGYIVAALAGATEVGIRSAIYYLAAYAFMNLGAFAVAALLSSEREEGTQLVSYEGLAARRPLLAAAMTFFMLSLAGMPITAGFLGKIFILSATVHSGYWPLGAILIIGSAISFYVYFKIVRAMYARVERFAHPAVVTPSQLPWVAVAICALAVIVLTFVPVMPGDVTFFVK